MIALQPPAHRRRHLLIAALTCLTLIWSLAPTTANADPSLAELRAQADQLRHELDALTIKQQLAVEQYDGAREALDQATTEQVVATSRLQDVERAQQDVQAASAQRVRAIYISGGTLGMAASVLNSTSISDVLSRWRALETITRQDTTTVRLSAVDVADQVRTADTAEQTRLTTRQRQKAATDALAAVQTALAEQKKLIAGTDAKVVALAEQQRRDAEALATQQAAFTALQLGIGTTTDPSGALPPAPTATAARAIAAARTRLGAPYVWGATGPGSFDCSGLTQWAYRQAGLLIPRTSRDQYAALTKVPLDQLQPGDLVFYATNVSDPSTIHHVGMYLGAGLSIYAPETGDVVKIGSVAYGRIIGAVRPALS